MKPFVFFLLALFSLSSFGQKEEGWTYNKKTKIVSDKKTPLFKIFRDSTYSSQVLVTNLHDSLLVIFISKEMQGLVPSTKRNPKGAVYCKACILNTPKQKSVEVEDNKSLAYYTHMVYNNRLIAENRLDTTAVNVFVTKTGNPYTEKYLVYDEKSKTYSYPFNN